MSGGRDARPTSRSLIAGPQGRGPVAVAVARDLHLPRPAADRAILHVRLPARAGIVDVELRRLAAVRAGNGNELGHGNSAGGTLFFVACSNAYARRISVGSLQAMPVKLTPYGAGLALKSSGNAVVGAFGTNANGTITVG